MQMILIYLVTITTIGLALYTLSNKKEDLITNLDVYVDLDDEIHYHRL
jgi:hypothetical protein